MTSYMTVCEELLVGLFENFGNSV